MTVDHLKTYTKFWIEQSPVDTDEQARVITDFAVFVLAPYMRTIGSVDITKNEVLDAVAVEIIKSSDHANSFDTLINKFTLDYLKSLRLEATK